MSTATATSPVGDPLGGRNLSYTELCSIADRQKTQIQRNATSIAQRDARLRNLRHQENSATHQALSERLVALRDRVATDEQSLSRLKNLRNQVDEERNVAKDQGSDLDTVKRLFAQKEMELAHAVARVDELKRQLDELRQRNGKNKFQPTLAELEHLRREIKLRHSRNGDHRDHIERQRCILHQRQQEARQIDARFEQLSERLQASSPARPTAQFGGQKPELSGSQPPRPQVAVSERPRAAIEPFQIVSSQPQPTNVEEGKPKSALSPFVQNLDGQIGQPAELTVQNVQTEPITHSFMNSKGYATALQSFQDAMSAEMGAGKQPPATSAGATFAPPPKNSGASLLGPRPYVKLAQSDGTPTSIYSSNRSKEESSAHQLAAARGGLYNTVISVRNSPTPSSTDESDSQASTVRSYRPHQASLASLAKMPMAEPSKPVSEGVSPQDRTRAPPVSEATHNPDMIVEKQPLRRISNNSNSSRVNVSISRRIQMPDASLFEETPPPDLIPVGEIQRLKNAAGPSAAVAHRTQEEFYTSIESDKLHLRADNMRAAKRRSWAEQAASNEAEHIRRLLHREQLRGRPNINFSLIFNERMANDSENLVQGEGLSKVPESILPEHQEMTELHSESPSPETVTEDISQSSDDREPMVTRFDVDAPSASGSSQISPLSPLPSPMHVKGILKKPGAEKKNIRIQFDPLAMLLDASLEGELELVKKSAQRLCSVNVSNDEGITALHNAICAGHYEIVRYLVEAEADVNAQDADGWTPLHCAASCNNLPMVKFLLENGACVFATSICDHETPADKCEEEEDGFDGCSQFLLTIQDKLGEMNSGRVYAAYEYSAKETDELSFQQGDELIVLRRDDGERGWWWATHSKSGREGFVPRNYLSLYPRLAQQRQMAREFSSPVGGDENNNKNQEGQESLKSSHPLACNDSWRSSLPAIFDSTNSQLNTILGL